MIGTEPRLSITHARADARRVLVVDGTIDLDGARRLAQALQQAGVRHEPVAIDLCDARVNDAAGVALLVNAVRRLHRRRPDVKIVCPHGRTRTALQRAGLARRVTLDTDRAALAAGAPQRTPVVAVAGGSIPVRRQHAATPRRRGALLAEATLAIEARFAEPDLALGDVAREIATSKRQLQRVFAELAGSAFRDELAAVRMQHAARLLQTTELPVGDVALQVGYRQAAQFAKAFRRHHDASPSVFRRARR
jgi:AraC family transcriptional regulator, regulatory protein of adaptative response / methylphosphotriester-DNA alkyltransferase methyltransferase